MGNQENNQNRLKPENCNKAKCKTCIFGPTPIKLTQGRINEIVSYLVKGESSHICHTTNLTCYGALELQAKTFYTFGLIPVPTVDSLLATAQAYLKSENKG